MFVVAAFLVCVVVSQYNNTLRKAAEQKIRLSQIGKLHFKGKVINSKIYRYYGKNYYMICVKLDSTNIKNFFVYNNLDCLKVKNGIATFSAGYLNHTLGMVDSVEANMNNSGKVIYYYSAHAKDSSPLGFAPNGLHEDDLKSCE